MSKMLITERVKEQYADDKNLLTRIKLHEKHSTNHYGFPNWLFDQYQFTDNCRILELGCGTGTFWETRINNLPCGSHIVLSDFLDNMVNNVWRKYSKYPNVLVQRIDIQDIPFPSDSFDFVIANHMLYHVPDLSKAISEVYRILKPKGIFYCTTNGTEGMSEYLHNALKQFNPAIDAFRERYSFSLQNGYSVLVKYFDNIKLIEYIDSLRVTETQDLINWIESTITINDFSKNGLVGLYDYFEDIRREKGSIDIPKQSGIFISIK